MSHRMDEYTQELASLHYTQEQKNRLAAVSVHLAQQDTPRPTYRRRPVRRALLITAAVCALLIGTASATGMLKTIAEWFSPIFGTSSTQQADIINEIGTPIGVSDTDNGITLTAEAIVLDKYNLCVAYTISWEDDDAIDLPDWELSKPDFNTPGPKQYLLFEKPMYMLDTTSGYGVDYWFTDADPNDNQIEYYETYSSNGTPDALTTGELTVDLENIQAVTMDQDNNVTHNTIATGHWQLTFDATSEKDCSVTPGNVERNFEAADFSITVKDITISPIAVHIGCEFQSELFTVYDIEKDTEELENRRMEKTEQLQQIPVILTKTDGTTVDLTNGNGFSISSDDTTAYLSKGGILSEITPIEDMQSISIGDITYDIPHN
ncbi:MAG: DUF4179 domain-containing protein [Eubacteriales bacterium]|nr:DUF4179 domain-containing protein [Eubacteriales bacterium]